MFFWLLKDLQTPQGRVVSSQQVLGTGQVVWVEVPEMEPVGLCLCAPEGSILLGEPDQRLGNGGKIRIYLQ